MTMDNSIMSAFLEQLDSAPRKVEDLITDLANFHPNRFALSFYEDLRSGSVSAEDIRVLLTSLHFLSLCDFNDIEIDRPGFGMIGSGLSYQLPCDVMTDGARFAVACMQKTVMDGIAFKNGDSYSYSGGTVNFGSIRNTIAENTAHFEDRYDMTGEWYSMLDGYVSWDPAVSGTFRFELLDAMDGSNSYLVFGLMEAVREISGPEELRARQRLHTGVFSSAEELKAEHDRMIGSTYVYSFMEQACTMEMENSACVPAIPCELRDLVLGLAEENIVTLTEIDLIYDAYMLLTDKGYSVHLADAR